MKDKKSSSKRAKKVKKNKPSLLTQPDISVLEKYSPLDLTNAHPDWIKEEFSSYLSSHTGHDATAVREFSHGGHTVRILTTYRVEVDGAPVRAHLSVDEDGQVYSHATPFVTYGSAIDLMKAIIDGYPTSFSRSNSHNIPHEHNHLSEGHIA